MRYLFGLLILTLIVAGCISQPATDFQAGGQAMPKQDAANAVNGTGVTVPANDSGTQASAPLQTDPQETTDYTSVATSQASCSTLSPDCASCLAKKGCAWCKGTNACYYEGIIPTISSCSPDSWATTVSECSVVPEGGSCSQFTNCASCLSGTGCNWCIQGSICKQDSTTDKCFGGWLNQSYQCNYASR